MNNNAFLLVRMEMNCIMWATEMVIFTTPLAISTPICGMGCTISIHSMSVVLILSAFS